MWSPFYSARLCLFAPFTFHRRRPLTPAASCPQIRIHQTIALSDSLQTQRPTPLSVDFINEHVLFFPSCCRILWPTLRLRRVDNDEAGKYLSWKVQSHSRPLICPSIAPSLIEQQKLSGYHVFRDYDDDDDDEDDESEKKQHRHPPLANRLA